MREQIGELEREDVRLYNATLADGWSVDELRRLGLAEPDKKDQATPDSPADSPDSEHT